MTQPAKLESDQGESQNVSAVRPHPNPLPRGEGTGTAYRPPTSLTLGLSELAVEQAAAVAARAPIARAFPIRPLARAAAVLFALAAVIGLLVLLMPGLADTEWNRFVHPFADVPPFSPIVFTVTPGDKSVIYGGELDIRAAASVPVDQMELVLEGPDGESSVLPMFPESGESWRAVLAKITEPTAYYVRSYRARSPRYQISVITVPQIESVRLRIAPPAYANWASYEGPPPKDGIAGLRGTKVTVWAASNRPLGGGTLAVPGKKEVPMRPAGDECREAVGEFEITSDGKFECRVSDQAGQMSQDSFSSSVALVADQRPFVRIVRPPAVSLATPTALVPVLMSGEDDCGIARLQLFRSLNDSRPLPQDVPLPPPLPHRRDEQIYLPLSGYRLEPGDIIKFFARVEDNDPAGSKGAESQMVVVRIISQEEFDRMVRARQGLEALASKYREALRRMESLDKDTEGLRKKVKDQPPDSRLTPQVRQEMQRLQRLLREQQEHLRRAAANKMPFDLDHGLTPELDQLARMTDEMAKELEKLEKQKDLLNKDLAKKLEELTKRLAAGRQRYQRLVAEPMEHLEAVFPLLVAQERFTALVLRQQDLAERMAALKGHDREDDPALKARMRDLEHEQRQVREALVQLLDDIENHAARLPDKPELEKLRETAVKFVKDVRRSGALEAMGEAEKALAEFAGTRAHEQAKLAADILAKFLKQCQGGDGLAGQCRGCLVFQPVLANCLGDTLAQLLAQIGGRGSGGMGTYGLFGNMGGMSGSGSGEFGDPHGPSGHQSEDSMAGRTSGGNPDRPSPWGAAESRTTGGLGEGAIPVRYRRQVGQYFQRIAEEVGERK